MYVGGPMEWKTYRCDCDIDWLTDGKGSSGVIAIRAAWFGLAATAAAGTRCTQLGVSYT